MPSINRWKKYLQEAIGEDLRKENEPLLSLSQVAKLRNVDPIEAMSSILLGPLSILYITSPSFKREIDLALNILPEVSGFVINEKNVQKLVQKLKNIRSQISSEYTNPEIANAVAYIKAKYPKLASTVDAIEEMPLFDYAGLYDQDLKKVYIDPTKVTSSLDAAEIIAHELLHAYEHTKNPAKYNFILEQVFTPELDRLRSLLKSKLITEDEYWDLYSNIPGESRAYRAGDVAKRTYEKFLSLSRSISR